MAIAPDETQMIAGIHLQSDVGEKLPVEIGLGKLVDLDHEGCSREWQKLVNQVSGWIRNGIRMKQNYLPGDLGSSFNPERRWRGSTPPTVAPSARRLSDSPNGL